MVARELNLSTVPVVSLVMEISSSLSLLESLETDESVALGVAGDAWVAEEVEVVSLTNFDLGFAFVLQASHCHVVFELLGILLRPKQLK